MRKAEINRKTNETSIELALDLDGAQPAGSAKEIDISTSVGFFDHMLTLMAHHGGFGLRIKATGDTHIDDHHIVEDIGIALGKAFYEAAGDKADILRYGQCLLPMDEALVESAVDFGGRSYLHIDLPFTWWKVGSFDLQLVEEFFRAFSSNARITLHIIKRHGTNDHHIAEAAFKSVARALRQALTISTSGVNSTKGVLE